MVKKKFVVLVITICLLIFSAADTVFADVYSSDIVSLATQFLGYPYGHSYGPNSFDCIGLVKYVFGQYGITIPWSTSSVWNNPTTYGQVISDSSALPGDVVIVPGHAGIYVGNGQMINALNYDAGVCYTGVENYRACNYDGDGNCVSLYKPSHKFLRIYNVNYGQKNGYLDVNGLLDGQNVGATGNSEAIYGTFDVYINGSRVADDQWDFVKEYPVGTTYEIKDIKERDGFSYDGCVGNNLSGTITAGKTIDVRLIFNSCRLDVSGNLDGIVSDTVSPYATFDVYIGGKLKKSGVNDFNERVTKGVSYQITNIKTENGYELTGNSGSLSGTIGSGKKTVTLKFHFDSTPNSDWKVVSNMDNLPSGVTLKCEIQYITQTSKESVNKPDEDGWVKTGASRTVYENDGATYWSDIELTTSATRELVDWYYYHYCAGDKGVNSDHTIRNGYVHYDSVDRSLVNEIGGPYNDNTGDGYKYYKLQWKSGGDAKCYSGKTCDGSNGSHGERSYYWYRMSLYQNKKAVTYYTWVKNTGWTATLPSNATIVAFRYRLKGFSSFVLPANLKQIQNSAFEGSKSIEEVTIPDGVTSIGARAFANCSNLIVVRIPDSVTSIGANAFLNDSNLTFYCHSDNSECAAYASRNGISSKNAYDY